MCCWILIRTTLLAHQSHRNVGIGTASPNDKLEVNGNIRFTAAGQGINFNNYGSGANIKSNLLDDYEEGTWTPTIVGGITNPVYAGGNCWQLHQNWKRRYLQL